MPIIDQQAVVSADDAGFDMAKKARKKNYHNKSLPNSVLLQVSEIENSLHRYEQVCSNRHYLQIPRQN
jgi:hypothetical protein